VSAPAQDRVRQCRRQGSRHQVLIHTRKRESPMPCAPDKPGRLI
jgi:hypothetical protein